MLAGPQRRRAHVYYRVSDAGTRDGKLECAKWETCYVNFLVHCNIPDAGWCVVADNMSDESYARLRALTKAFESEFEIVRTALGNSGSFLYVLGRALRLPNPDDIVYFVEDDYLHTGLHVCRALRAGLAHADYVSLYDNPTRPYESRTTFELESLMGRTQRWRDAPDTCMTFAATVRTLQADRDFFVEACAGPVPRDFEMWARLRTERGRRLITPVPSVCTHVMEDALAPEIDWERCAAEANAHIGEEVGLLHELLLADWQRRATEARARAAARRLVAARERGAPS